MADIIQIRRDTAANWTAANPILAQGEFGVETDTLKLKIGDGASPWTGLRYYHSGSPYDAGEGISINDFTINNTGIITVGTGSTNGTIKANGQDIAVKGLGSAAFVDTTTLPNKDLSNLSSTGQNIANWSSNVTNCITTILQDIKLELNNGTLTLKAGSKVYVPNGAGVFDLITTTQDCSMSGTIGANNNKVFIAYRNNAITTRPVSLSVSGAGATTVSGFAFDTTTNKINFYNASGVLQSTDWSFPIAIVSTNSSGGASSIDQVFNGFGYIGRSIFSLPAVRVLRPAGRNDNGTLKNNTGSIPTVAVRTFDTTDVFDKAVVGWWGGFSRYDYNNWTYNEIENRNYISGTIWNWAVIGTIKLTNGVISEFNIKTPFHAVDYNDYQNTVEQVNANTTNIVLKQDEATALNYDNISNCITEIPQDINVTITNGNLIMDAGSKVYFPNGSGTFDVFALPTNFGSGDVSGITADYMFFINASKTGIAGTPVTNAYSGTTAPASPSTGTIWYDTTNNSVKRWSGSAWVGGFSLPVVILSAGAVLKQVFNGFGYVGSTVFALPGVKTLRPNGRNADGTLKTLLQQTTSVVVRTFTNALPNTTIMGIGSNSALSVVGSGYYDEKDNYVYDSYSPGVIQPLAICAKIKNSSSSPYKITLLEPKNVFHAVDYSDTEYMAHQAMPSRKYIDLTLGASGASYTAPADGYFALASTFNANGYLYMYRGSGGRYGTTLTYVASQWVDSFIPVAKGDVVLIQYNGTASVQSFRFIYANGAE